MDCIDYESGRRCDGFWFRGKMNLIDIIMSKNMKRRVKILNVGVGTGDDLRVLKKYGDNYVIDINKKAIDMIKRGLCVEKKVADACKMPFPNKTFDVVISFDVLEHIENDTKAVSEIHRVLKDGGKFIFGVPAFNFLFSSHDRALEHKRRYNKPMLKKLMKDFSNARMFYWNASLFVPVAALRKARKNSPSAVDNPDFPKPINDLLYFLLSTESNLLKRGVQMPFGLSIVGICEK